MSTLTKEQLIADREQYRVGLAQLRAQQGIIEKTIQSQLGVLAYLDLKIATIVPAPTPAAEPAAAQAPVAPHPRSDAAEPE